MKRPEPRSLVAESYKSKAWCVCVSGWKKMEMQIGPGIGKETQKKIEWKTNFPFDDFLICALESIFSQPDPRRVFEDALAKRRRRTDLI